MSRKKPGCVTQISRLLYECHAKNRVSSRKQHSFRILFTKRIELDVLLEEVLDETKQLAMPSLQRAGNSDCRRWLLLFEHETVE